MGKKGGRHSHLQRLLFARVDARGLQLLRVRRAERRPLVLKPLFGGSRE